MEEKNLITDIEKYELKIGLLLGFTTFVDIVIFAILKIRPVLFSTFGPILNVILISIICILQLWVKDDENIKQINNTKLIKSLFVLNPEYIILNCLKIIFVGHQGLEFLVKIFYLGITMLLSLIIYAILNSNLRDFTIITGFLIIIPLLICTYISEKYRRWIFYENFCQLEEIQNKYKVVSKLSKKGFVTKFNQINQDLLLRFVDVEAKKQLRMRNQQQSFESITKQINLINNREHPQYSTPQKNYQQERNNFNNNNNFNHNNNSEVRSDNHLDFINETLYDQILKQCKLFLNQYTSPDSQKRQTDIPQNCTPLSPNQSISKYINQSQQQQISQNLTNIDTGSHLLNNNTENAFYKKSLQFIPSQVEIEMENKLPDKKMQDNKTTKDFRNRAKELVSNFQVQFRKKIFQTKLICFELEGEIYCTVILENQDSKGNQKFKELLNFQNEFIAEIFCELEFFLDFQNQSLNTNKNDNNNHNNKTNNINSYLKQILDLPDMSSQQALSRIFLFNKNIQFYHKNCFRIGKYNKINNNNNNIKTNSNQNQVQNQKQEPEAIYLIQRFEFFKVLFQGQTINRNLNVSVKYQNHLIKLQSIPNLIDLIIFNLFLNAINQAHSYIGIEIEELVNQNLLTIIFKNDLKYPNFTCNSQSSFRFKTIKFILAQIGIESSFRFEISPTEHCIRLQIIKRLEQYHNHQQNLLDCSDFLSINPTPQRKSDIQQYKKQMSVKSNKSSAQLNVIEEYIEFNENPEEKLQRKPQNQCKEGQFFVSLDQKINIENSDLQCSISNEPERLLLKSTQESKICSRLNEKQ